MGRGALHPVQQVRAGVPARRHSRQGLSARRSARARPPRSRPWRSRRASTAKGMVYTMQVAPEDCTGCSLCVQVCPAKDKANPRHKALDMTPQAPLVATPSARTTTFFLELPEADRTQVKLDVKGTQFLQPLFEYSGACAGCGETPYIKLMTQLFGDRAAHRQRHRLLVDLRRQPADDAVHDQPRRPRPGVGELALRGQRGVRPRHAPGGRPARGAWREALLASLRAGRRATTLRDALLDADQTTRRASRRSANASSRPAAARWRHSPRPRRGDSRRSPTTWCRKSVWIVGGDGWAYDIGYGGLDHVLALGPQRQHAGARHRGLLEHRRPAVEGDAARRGRQVRDAPARPRAKKDLGAHGDGLRPRLRRPGRLRREGRADGEGAASRPRPIPGRRSSSPTATASRTATTWSTGSSSRSWRSTPATGRSSATTRGAPADGENPFAARLGAAEGRRRRRSMRNETRFRLVEQQDPERFKALLAQGQGATSRSTFAALRRRWPGGQRAGRAATR